MCSYLAKEDRFVYFHTAGGKRQIAFALVFFFLRLARRGSYVGHANGGVQRPALI